MQPQARAFEGQTAVITGGGTGVGAAVALALAGAGASLHLIGRRLDVLEEIAAKARGRGVQATSHFADLSTTCGQLDLTQRLARDLPHVDVLIQNAAMHSSGTIEQAKLAEFD